MIFRRHRKGCPYRRKKRRYWRCGCPIWLDTRINGRRVLKSMNETDWEAAQKLEQHWLAGTDARDTDPEPPRPAPAAKEEPISVAQAWENYIAAAKNRTLSATPTYTR